MFNLRVSIRVIKCYMQVGEASRLDKLIRQDVWDVLAKEWNATYLNYLSNVFCRLARVFTRVSDSMFICCRDTDFETNDRGWTT